jgi:hypothetical protein
MDLYIKKPLIKKENTLRTTMNARSLLIRPACVVADV